MLRQPGIHNFKAGGLRPGNLSGWRSVLGIDDLEFEALLRPIELTRAALRYTDLRKSILNYLPLRADFSDDLLD